MRKYLLSAAAVAAVATATPATARDGSGYVGIEAGLLFPKDSRGRLNGVGTGTATITGTNIESVYYEGYGYYDVEYTETIAEAPLDLAAGRSFKTDHKRGTDVDLVAGYDFGMFRLEAELGYKRVKHDTYKNVSQTQTIDYVDYYGEPAVITNTFTGDLDADGNTTVFSVMGNALLDFGDEDGLSFYAGGGLGWAKTKQTYDFGTSDAVSRFRLSDSGLAMQLIAGARYAVSPNMDIGLKYRYFHGNKMKDSFTATNVNPRFFFDEAALIEGFDVESPDFDFVSLDSVTLDSATLTGDSGGRFKSHSLMLSLIFNFGAAPPPPPPPPPQPPPPEAPATQTCPDGSVILATDVCPVPPPPPPPPPAPVGERG